MDNLGRLPGLILSPGQASDHTYAPALAQKALDWSAEVVMDDKGYYSNSLRMLILDVVIPFRKNRKIHPEIDWERYKEKNIVERFVGKIRENRRVATRHDKNASHYVAFIILAAIKAWLKNIC